MDSIDPKSKRPIKWFLLLVFNLALATLVGSYEFGSIPLLLLLAAAGGVEDGVVPAGVDGAEVAQVPAGVASAGDGGAGGLRSLRNNYFVKSMGLC